ncbi:MAG: type I pullulanase, partial [Erysipelotrichaceae bacterium]|nr:type I pullulanase [Erysipelotrichaceae bacterium]
RKFILDSVKHWMKVYGIDGFRFDLMGIIDIDTMNAVLKTVKAINVNGMVYGEGWNMPTALDDGQKASLLNNDKMPGIAHFNDYFRDVVKGKTSDDERYDQGYLTGNLFKIREMESALIANAAMAQGYDYIYVDPNHSISYVECHDNCTSWDKMKDCCKDAVREVRIQKHKMMIAAVMFAQGVPFIHSGQEFCRTKLQYSNTYNKPDTINGIDWARRCAFNDVVEYTKACIKVRKKYQAFKLNTMQEIIASVRFNVVDNAVLEYTINCWDEKNQVGEVKVIFNPTETQKYLSYENDLTLVLDDQGLVEQPLLTRVAIVKPYSCMVLVR